MSAEINHKDEEVGKRIEHCKNCEHLVAKINICKKCGCFMPAKVRLKWASCPIGKWGKVDGAKAVPITVKLDPPDL